MATTIIHPTDFSPPAEAARGLALQLARALSGELLLLHVAVEAPLFREGPTTGPEVARLYEDQRRWAQQTLEGYAAAAREQGVPATVRVVTGAPHQEIVAAARREGAAFIVMGTHGRGGVERFLLGSVADRVIRTAPCPVVTRRDFGDAAG
jgi:nucleotide-binding universal stress UspA family protein